MWGNTFEAATPAWLHRAFISAQICLRERGFPFLVRNTAPEAFFSFLVYCSSFFRSLPGMRMVRIFRLREISALPSRRASTVRYCTSLTRIPVAQMASISRARRSLPWARAVESSLSYSCRVSSFRFSRKSLR